mgnify:CR=1 FL=1
MSRKVDILAINETISTFEGIEFIPCMFLTALCPDRCGHAKNVAKFKVVEYIKYEKPGKYGDDKSEYFMVDINPNAEEDKQPQEFLNVIKTLKVGDKVKLNWNHLYINTEHACYPERTITLLEPIK